MPQLDSYNQGTVALNANTTLVVGTETGWRDANGVVQQVNLGDWFVLGTFAALIMEVISPTQIRLATAYPGPAVSGAGYDIVRYTQLATPALVAFMQRERKRGGPDAPLVRLDVDTGNVRISLRDGGDGKAGIYVGGTATADGAQVRGLGFDGAGNAEFAGKGGLLLPAGSTAERLAEEGRFRRNTQTNRVEAFVDGAWREFVYRDGESIEGSFSGEFSGHHEGDFEGSLDGDVAAPNVIRTGGKEDGSEAFGGVALRRGDADRPGYAEWRTKDGVRRSYMGWRDGTDPRIVWQLENGWGAQLNGPFSFEQRPTFAGKAAIDMGNFGWVTPEMLISSAGTGGDDRLAIQMAVSTGKGVWLDPSREYRTSAPIYVDGTVGQHIAGGILRPIGNFNAIVARGAKGLVLDIAARCADMSGGYAVEFRENCERCSVRRLHILDAGYNALYIEQCNNITVDYIYAIHLRGDRGVRWFGSASKRSDVLNLNNAHIAAYPGHQGLVGFDWDGNCHSLTSYNLQTVNCFNGLLMRNSAGGGIPQIGRFYLFASDFSYDHGVNIAAGDDVDFTAPYLNGAGYTRTGANIYHGMLADYGSSGTVRVQGGKCIGNKGHGFVAGPAGALFVHGTRCYANADTNGHNLHASSLLLT